jgi:hypothetical protein
MVRVNNTISQNNGVNWRSKICREIQVCTILNRRSISFFADDQIIKIRSCSEPREPRGDVPQHRGKLYSIAVAEMMMQGLVAPLVFASIKGRGCLITPVCGATVPLRINSTSETESCREIQILDNYHCTVLSCHS